MEFSAKQEILVGFQQEAEDGREYADNGNEPVPQPSFGQDRKREQAKEWPIGISGYFQDDADHAVARDPFVNDHKYQEHKNKCQVNPLTDLFSARFGKGLIPVNAQDIYTEGCR